MIELKRILPLLVIILCLLPSAAAGSVFLIEDVYPGGDGAIVAAHHAELYCNAQRGCSPVGAPSYFFYNGKSFTSLSDELKKYIYVGFYNGSWIFRRNGYDEDIWAFNGKNMKRLAHMEQSRGIYDSFREFITSKGIIVAHNIYPQSRADLYLVGIDGKEEMLGSVDSPVINAAWDEYLFIQGEASREYGYYSYYILMNSTFHKIGEGHMWFDYHAGNALVAAWGSFTLNSILANALGNLTIVNVPSFVISLGWNGTWYLYPGTTIDMNEKLWEERRLLLISPSGRRLGRYYIARPHMGETYAVTSERFVKLEGLGFFNGEDVGEYMALAGFETFGWAADFSDDSIYLYDAERGEFIIWNLLDKTKETFHVGEPVLRVVNCGGFVLLYEGKVFIKGGGYSSLYVYDGELKKIEGELRGSLKAPPEKKVNIPVLISNGTHALIYTTAPDASPEEPGDLYVFNGTSFLYLGHYYPEAWVGEWIIGGLDDQTLYAFNGSCLRKMNITGEVEGKYLIRREGNRKEVYYYSNGSYVKVAELNRDCFFRYETSGYALFGCSNSSYISNGKDFYTLPFGKADIFHGDGFLVTRHISMGRGIYRTEVYMWNPGNLTKVGELSGLYFPEAYLMGSWLLVSPDDGIYLYSAEHGRLMPFMKRTGKQRFLAVGRYIIRIDYDCAGFCTYNISAFKWSSHGVRFLGTVPGDTEFLSYYAEENLVIGAKNAIVDLTTGKFFPINGTLFVYKRGFPQFAGIQPFRGGWIAYNDYGIYTYTEGYFKNHLGELIQTKKELGTSLCGTLSTSSPAASTTSPQFPNSSSSAETHQKEWLAVLLLAGAIAWGMKKLRR